jgi:DNA-binding transcriptional LysR family regulator
MNGTTYQQLVIFQTIVQEGSIRAAARRLELAAPSVSQSLKALENSMRLPLLLRTTRRMELTEAGQMLFDSTLPAIATLNYAVESVRNLSEAPSGTVRLTLPRFVAQFFLMPVYAEFCERYPHIQLELSASDATVNIISQGFDAGIRFGDRIEEGMVARALTPPIKDALFASPEYLERHGTPQTPNDLRHHKLIQYRFIASNQLAPLELQDGENRIRVEMPTALVVNDTDLIMDAAQKNLGIGRFLLPMVRPLLKSGALLPVLAKHWPVTPGLYLYYPQNSQKARRIRVLIDFLCARAISEWPAD